MEWDDARTSEWMYLLPLGPTGSEQCPDVRAAMWNLLFACYLETVLAVKCQVLFFIGLEIAWQTLLIRHVQHRLD